MLEGDGDVMWIRQSLHVGIALELVRGGTRQTDRLSQARGSTGLIVWVVSSDCYHIIHAKGRV